MKGVEVRGLAFHAGGFRFGPFDLAVPPATICSLLGPAGSGKSLFARAVSGFHPLDAGALSLDGRRIDGLVPEARRIGWLPPGGALFTQLSVRGNVAFGARRRGGAIWEDRVRQALAQVAAGPLADRMPRDLSRAECCRVALARALASAPGMLLLDDPLDGLEPADRRALLDLLVRLLPRTGLPVVYTTRDARDLAALGGEAVLVRSGTVVQTGPTAALLSYPVSAWAAGRVGFENVLPGWVMGPGPDGLAVAAGRGVLAFPDGPDLPRGHPVFWGVRAGWVTVEAGRGGGPNRLAGRIEQSSFDGSVWRLRLDCGVPLVAEVRPGALPPTSSGLPPGPGDPVTAVLPIEHVRLWRSQGRPGDPALPPAGGQGGG